MRFEVCYLAYIKFVTITFYRLCNDHRQACIKKDPGNTGYTKHISIYGNANLHSKTIGNIMMIFILFFLS